MGAELAGLGIHFETHDALGRAVELVPGATLSACLMLWCAVAFPGMFNVRHIQ